MKSQTAYQPEVSPNLLTDPWEAAYARFETPQEERRKFIRRLLRLGATNWPVNARIVELFCGRGNGLIALAQLGFTHLEGVDLSPALIQRYSGPAKCHVADCRKLPFADSSKDILIVQGGLHHLPNVTEDLNQVLAEASRVLKNHGRLIVVEPWRTVFLSCVHWLCENAMVRHFSNKCDAFAEMVRYERTTYEAWLNQPEAIFSIFRQHFCVERSVVRWGKWECVARRPTRGSTDSNH